MFDKLMETLNSTQLVMNINTMINLSYAIINIRKALNSKYLTKRDRKILHAVLEQIESYLEANLGHYLQKENEGDGSG